VNNYKEGAIMPAKKGFQRVTVDIPQEEHARLKIMATVLGKSMHDIIVRGIYNQMESFKGIESVDKLRRLNSGKQEG